MGRRAVWFLFLWTTGALAARGAATVGAYYYPWYGPGAGGHAAQKNGTNHDQAIPLDNCCAV